MSQLHVAALGLLMVVGCSQEHFPPKETLRGAINTEDGVPMAFIDRPAVDKNAATLLFIHCWACNQQFWREQVPAVEGAYRVVTFDLPGHGDSRANRERWSVHGFADDVVRLADERRLTRMILIGHSMGGPIALAAAAKLKGRVLGVVLVDTVHNAELAWPQETADQVADRFEADFDGAMSSSIRGMMPNANAKLVDWVMMQGRLTNHTAAVALMRDFPNNDAANLLAGADVPVRAINAEPYEPMGPPTAVEINRKYADYDVVFIEGVGHYLQLEKPVTFNEHLVQIVGHIAGSG